MLGEVERADQLVVRPGRVGRQLEVALRLRVQQLQSPLKQEEGWSPLTRRGRGRGRLRGRAPPRCELGCLQAGS